MPLHLHCQLQRVHSLQRAHTQQIHNVKEAKVSTSVFRLTILITSPGRSTHKHRLRQTHHCMVPMVLDSARRRTNVCCLRTWEHHIQNWGAWSHSRYKHCTDRHGVEYIPITHHVSSPTPYSSWSSCTGLKRSVLRVHTSQRSWAAVLSQLNLLGKLSVFRKANWSGVSTLMYFRWWAFLLQDFMRMRDQLPCKSDIDIHGNCNACWTLHSCLMGGQILLMDLSTYLAPTPLFSFILMSPNHGHLIVLYRINLSNSIH